MIRTKKDKKEWVGNLNTETKIAGRQYEGMVGNKVKGSGDKIKRD